mgnify:CR=1 FL=1|jgi:hypothetical protein
MNTENMMSSPKTDEEILRAIGGMLKNIKDKNTIDCLFDMFRAQSKFMETQIAVTFYKGQNVQFDAKTRGIIKGIITKVNQKTIVVKSGNCNWKVSPSLLEAI